MVSATAVLRERPDDEAAAVGQAKQGEMLRISSKSKEGWFKVLLPNTESSPQYGWISAQELIPLDLASEMRMDGVQSGNTKYTRSEDYTKPREWSLAVYYQVTSVNPHDVQGFVGLNEGATTKSTFAGEVNLSPSEWVGLSFYGSMVSDTGSSADETQSYTVSAGLLGGLVEYYPLRTTFHRLGLGLGILAVPVWMHVKRINATTGLEASGSQKFLTAGSLVRVSFRQHFTYRFGLGINAGYRYINQRSIGISGSSTNLQLSGLFGELGLFYDF